MPDNKPHIIYIPKWFPSPSDIQSGSFILKHAKAASSQYSISVVFPLFSRQVQEKKYRVEEEKAGNVNIYRIYISEPSCRFSGSAGLLKAWRYGMAILMGYKIASAKDGKPVLIHVHVLLRTGIAAMLLRLVHGIPWVITEHWSGYVNGTFRMKNYIYKALTREVIRRSSGISVVSEYLRNGLQECGIRKVIKILPDIIEKPAEENQKRDPGGKIIMLSVADLVDHVKNISAVIEAVDAVRTEIPQLEYHIIGDGPDRKRLMDLADTKGLLSERILFHGRKTPEEVYQYYPLCDFVVINSNYETFSMITAEALVHNKPVIATRCGGPEQFTNPENSISITPGNTKELIQAIKDMALNYKTLKPEKSALQILQTYSYEKVGTLMDDFYRQALKPK